MLCSKRKAHFLNQVAHELRTPLTSIRLYAELAEMRESGDAKLRQHLQVIPPSRRTSSAALSAARSSRTKRSSSAIIRGCACAPETRISSMSRRNRCETDI